MLADGSYEELPQREYVEEEGLPRQDKYAIGLPCPDTRGQKGIVHAGEGVTPGVVAKLASFHIRPALYPWDQ